MSSAAGSLAQDMLLAFRDQHLSDITVTAFDQTFYLHRLILLRSGYFRTLILGEADWIEKSRQAITLKFGNPYVTLTSFQRIIHWLYGIDYHYPENAAPSTFRVVKGPASSAPGVFPGAQGLAKSASSQYHGQASPSSVSGGSGGIGARHGLGLLHHTGSGESSESLTHPHHQQQQQQHSQHSLSNTEKRMAHGGTNILTGRRVESIIYDPSEKIDELLISMYATASYLNISALAEEICSDIAFRIRSNRGLICYMEYAWKHNNGKAWDIILAQCFYQLSWNAYKSMTLQDMLSSPDMPIVGIVKCLVSESLWVPSEYERYQLVKSILLRRLGLDLEKLMKWVYDYHDQDWFNIIKHLDDNGTWSYEMSADEILNNLQDWESTSTDLFEDAVDTDHEWGSSSGRESRRRSSHASSTFHLTELTALTNSRSLTPQPIGEDRAATPTIESVISGSTAAASMNVEHSNHSINNDPPTDRSSSDRDVDGDQGSTEDDPQIQKRTLVESTPLGTPLSSPALSAISISSDTLPRHQVRDLLVLMYLLHNSIHYTHMTFDQLYQVLNDGLVLPERVKDSFWRQHLLRRVAMSTSTNLPYLSTPSTPLFGRYHGANLSHRETQAPTTIGVSRAKLMGSSTRASPTPGPTMTATIPINSHGLLPIRFSTSLFISRRDLMTDGKHFTSSTFYGGSWWSIQVANNLTLKDTVGVYLTTTPTPRAISNSGDASSARSRSIPGAQVRTNVSQNSFSISTGAFPAPASTSANIPQVGSSRARRGVDHGTSSTPLENSASNGDCSSVYSRRRDLYYSYRIYMTSNVIEPPEHFAKSAASRLEELKKDDYSYPSMGRASHGGTNPGQPQDARTGAGGYGASAGSGVSSSMAATGAAAKSSFGPSPSMPTSPEMVSGAFLRTGSGFGYNGSGSSADSYSSYASSSLSASHRIASEDEMVCEDKFTLGEGWGYSRSNYLTRVARQVRDHPRRSQHPQDEGGIVGSTGIGSQSRVHPSTSGLQFQAHIITLQDR
ncbi:hypothetical protein BGW38_000957 [Lunasporangiospora selenospora]|uniref:BTB domain-containing protein n=1 Tax=Lunasporangiospora selenospora TaxID=979761 RepID=A0A9P6G1H1_9FUNG|nr:hypothetical protein BGW38_000957 [Lunasporangiospora selenospora]